MGDPDARARLADLMDQRRRDLRLTWDQVASRAGIHRETLRQIRAGTGALRPLSATGIEDALEWDRGSIDTLLADGETTTGAGNEHTWRRLATAVRARRDERGWTQLEVAARGGLSIDRIQGIEGTRSDRYSSRTFAKLERALEWESGSCRAILDGGDPTPSGLDPLAEAVLAQINPPPGTDLASVLGRLNDVSEQIQQITADVTIHGVAVGRVAVRLIGEYSTAWCLLVESVQRAAEQGGLIDARQMLDVMQKLHDRFEMQTRPPKDPKTTEGEGL
jgi:transcriptional regulator with XRE-family HTH domain